MSPNLALICDGRKFMWDGQPYETRDEASRALDAYEHDGFEARIVEEGDTFLVYTRRVVTQVTATAP